MPAPRRDEGLTDVLGASSDDDPKGSLRHRLKAKPGIREIYRVAVFLAGLVFIALGIALVALPGPLTIPPILLGLWIWSTEFAFAERFFDSFKAKAHDAWDHAKAHPKSSAFITLSGLVAAAAAFWAVGHFDLIDKAREAIS